MGVDPAEIDRDAPMLQARASLAAYEKDVPASCGEAVELFGQKGRIIPGIFLARCPSPSPRPGTRMTAVVLTTLR
ncbi:hypothetical protein [Methylobacterium sp. J-067]|uniref:hypothetical protein n=1 Tax=Methylobacterium sp. J-067 TaxID=2836648 RepID=UPI001FB9C37A|nr:hypothetical protein [Methylobacterium sp. J-067]MCJ2023448.1 hypothetical protein [Methylobacterium sp. J-067]